jgi:hypothetical protein
MPTPPSDSRHGEDSMPRIAPFDLAELDRMPANICVLGSDLRIAYVNPAWMAFGAANGLRSMDETCGLGQSVIRVTPEVMRPFYERLFMRARETAEPVEHDYECSSPTHRRLLRMRIYPCKSGAFVVVHSVLREAPHDGAARAALERTYRNERGLVVQCSNCRRVRRPAVGADETAEWDWVPAYVAHMPQETSHSICAVCVAFHY